MTALAVPQNSHRPQFDHRLFQPATASPRTAHSAYAGAAPAIARGSAGAMPSRVAEHRRSPSVGGANSSPSRQTINGALATRNGAAPNNSPPSPNTNKRPSSAPGSKQNLTVETRNGNADQESGARASPKPPLLRSKSEHAVRNDEESNGGHIEEDRYEWGARHGFEDHYQSEDIISQLANVGAPPHLLLACLCFRAALFLPTPPLPRGFSPILAFMARLISRFPKSWGRGAIRPTDHPVVWDVPIRFLIPTPSCADSVYRLKFIYHDEAKA
jgi:hypothetical protein